MISVYRVTPSVFSMTLFVLLYGKELDATEVNNVAKCVYRKKKCVGYSVQIKFNARCMLYIAN